MGCFILTDLIIPTFESDKDNARKTDEALQFEIQDINKGAKGIEWLDEGARDKLAAEWIEHYREENIPISLSEEVRLLREAGFSRIQLHFRSGQNCVLSARFGTRFDDYSRVLGELHKELDQITLSGDGSSGTRDKKYGMLFQENQGLQRRFYRTFGISGASFAIADNQLGQFTLLQEGARGADGYPIKFSMPIARPPARSGLFDEPIQSHFETNVLGYSEFINRLFQIERGRQSSQTIGNDGQAVLRFEFLKHLPAGVGRDGKETVDWHLCPESDILSLLVEWRWYVWIINHFAATTRLATLSFEDVYAPSPAMRKAELLFNDNFFHGQTLLRGLPEFSIKQLDREECWNDKLMHFRAWKWLRTQVDKCDNSIKSFGDQIEALAKIAGRVAESLARLSFEKIKNKSVQLGPGRTVGEALAEFHKHAEIPVCPYFYFVSADGRSKSHFVVTLLRSETSPIKTVFTADQNQNRNTAVAVALVSLDASALDAEVADAAQQHLQLYQLKSALGICANRMIDRLFVDRLHSDARKKVRDIASKIIVAAQVTTYLRVFILGSFDHRITFYSQQARALQLVRALHEKKILRALNSTDDGPRIAIVGGGIAGVTCASALLLLGYNVTIYEKGELLNLQKSAKHRYIFPRLAEWPDDVSLLDTPKLPVMNWQASSASKVVRMISEEWHELMKGRLGKNCTVQSKTEVNSVRQLDEAGEGIELQFTCAGTTAARETKKCLFDIVIMAIGHGVEEGSSDHAVVNRYWEPDTLTTIPTDRGPGARVIIAGTGDGGLVDFLRVATGKPSDEAGGQREFFHSLASHASIQELGVRFRDEVDLLLAARKQLQVRIGPDDFLSTGYQRVFDALSDTTRQELLNIKQLEWRSGIERITLVHRSPDYFKLESLLFNRTIAFLLKIREPARFATIKGTAPPVVSYGSGKQTVNVATDDGEPVALECDYYVPRQGVPRNSIFKRIAGLEQVHEAFENRIAKFEVAAELDSDTADWYGELVSRV